MRILLFGKNGQVGWELQRTLPAFGDVIAVDLPEIDFNDLKGLRDFTLETKPDLIVNAAAYTAVDKAESEPEIAMRVNGEAPGVLAEVARKLNVGLIHYSTDYVFDGTKGEPYTEEDEPNPINVYGKTKWAGDLAIQSSGCAYIILRTSWVYGARGKNFFLTILRLAREKEEIRVVDDQIGCPTWCHSIAEATTKILDYFQVKAGNFDMVSFKDVSGLYNYCSSGEVSWFGFAEAILALDGKFDQRKIPTLIPIESEQYPTDAIRPIYSVLETRKVIHRFQIDETSWRLQLDHCWQRMNSNDSENVL